MQQRLTNHTGDRTAERFNLLIEEILRGELRRSNFLRWELELFVDIATSDPSMAEIREYRIAATHQLRHKGGAPIKLSEYLARRRRNQVTAGQGQARESHRVSEDSALIARR